MVTLHDRHWLRQAFLLALKGIATSRPNPRVGAVVVLENQKIAEGWHYRAGAPHAEVMALNQAGDKAKNSTLYVTLEPCSHQGKTPPCTDAIINAGIRRVIYASPDPNPLVSGFDTLKKAGVEVFHADCLEEEFSSLNLGFFKRMSQALPLVKLKVATSLDGRISDKNKQSKWITGQLAREHAHRLRHSSCAIVTGIGTVLADDPNLTARYKPSPFPPIRVVLDSNARILEKANILSNNAPGLWVTRNNSDRVLPSNWQHLVCPSEYSGDSINLHWLLKELAKNGVNEVLVEAGGRLAGSFLEQNLVDEIWMYQAPKILGVNGQPVFNYSGQNVDEKPIFSIIHQERLGEDQLLVLSRGRVCSQV